MPLLSILIPVYNAERYIQRCIDSIVLQKSFSKKIQLVIINDGSTDNSLEIINSYALRFDNIKVISRENRGIGSTRNELIDSCNGQYFWFVDSDDYVSSDSLKLIIEQLSTNKYDLLMFGYKWITSQGEKEIIFKGEYDSGIEATKERMFHNALWVKVYRSSVIFNHNIRFDTLSMGEDFDFVFRATIYIKNIYCIEEVLYYYVENATSAVSNEDLEHRLRSSEDSLRCIKQNMECLNNLKGTDRKAMLWPMEYFVVAYIYSLFIYPFDIDYKLKCLEKLEEYKVFPFESKFDSLKLHIFKQMMNIPILRKFSVYCNNLLLKIK